jgi:hypothetical protein
MSSQGQFIIGTPPFAPVESLTGNSGGAVPPNIAGNINIVGSGSVNVVGTPGTNTLTITVTGGGLAWHLVPGTSQAMASNNGYVTSNVGLTTFTFPPAPAFGDMVKIVGYGTGGWTLSIGAGEAVDHLATSYTATTLSSTQFNDNIELLCVDAGTPKIWMSLPGVGTLSNP